jgi:hypothetical protein
VTVTVLVEEACVPAAGDCAITVPAGWLESASRTRMEKPALRNLASAADCDNPITEGTVIVCADEGCLQVFVGWVPWMNCKVWMFDGSV